MSASERWRAFLQQIEARHREVAQEALLAAREALPELGFDTSPVAVALGAVRLRLVDLETRIDATFHEKVDAAFEAEGASYEARHQARELGEQLRRRLDRDRERLEPYAMAHAAQVLHQRAMTEEREVRCARCGAALRPPVTFRAIEVRCDACAAVGVFEPGLSMRMAEAGSHALAWVSAEREWDAMNDAEEAVRAQRSPCPLGLLQAYEAAQIAYWSRYFGTKVSLFPDQAGSRDPQGYIEHQVRAKLQFWYTYSAEHEHEWARAGRPRRLPPP